ncbi:unnamed protein product, partial [Choristocarpus tenellus]
LASAFNVRLSVRTRKEFRTASSFQYADREIGRWRANLPTASPTALSAGVDGSESTGSKVLVAVTLALLLRGALLPEDVRHLSFCPSEDPVRGRATIPWMMMEAEGRQCGSISEVLYKYLMSPVAFPGTPEWGTMLNVKEEKLREGW